MDYEWDDDILAFQKELRTFCEEFSTDLRAAEDQAGRDLVFKKVHGEMERRGWLRIAWPEEYGGGGKSPFYQFVMVQEFSYAGIPYGGLSVGSIAPALLNHGTDEQKQKFLPGILDGDITFAIGYSEPNAGTDLAALQTRAVKDGDE